MNTATSYVSKQKFPVTELYWGRFLKKEIFDLVKRDFPNFNENDYVSIESLNEYRKRYMATLLKQENTEINEMEKQVIESIAKNELLSKDLEEELSKDLTPAQCIADKIAGFGGSWTFILFFFFFLLLWMCVNVFVRSEGHLIHIHSFYSILFCPAGRHTSTRDHDEPESEGGERQKEIAK